MLISKESPLKRIPYSLERKQALFIDGIRFTIEMVDASHRHLVWMLEKIATDKSYRDKYPMAEPFSEVWSIVDSVYRLRSLIRQLPGIKQIDFSQRKIFLEKTKDVERFRHTVQHLDGEINQLAINNEPAWGSLNWFAVTKLYADDNSGKCQRIKTGCWCGMISGSVVISKSYKMGVIPQKATLKNKVSMVSLRSGDNYLSIDDCYKEVVKLKNALEKYIAHKFSKLPNSKSDIYVFARIDFEKEN